MSVNKTIDLKWCGVNYPLMVTMRHIDMIEEHINLMTMVRRVSEGDMRFSHAAHLISILLNLAGLSITQEEVFDGMIDDDGKSIDAGELAEMIQDILDVVFYRSKKKPIEKVKPTRKRSKSTRGKKSTK